MIERLVEALIPPFILFTMAVVVLVTITVLIPLVLWAPRCV